MLPDPLRRTLVTYCKVDACDIGALCHSMRAAPDTRTQVLSQLQHAIDTRSLTPAAYEQLTGEAFDSADELLGWLRTLHGRISAP